MAVPTGGVLLEAFCEGFGSYATTKDLRTARDLHMKEGDVDRQLLDGIVKRESQQFYGWILTSCANIRPKPRRQLFFLTFVARYHGLSTSGADILAQYGLLTKRHVYSKCFEEQLQQAIQRTK